MKRPAKLSSKVKKYCWTNGCTNLATVRARGELLCDECFSKTGLKLHKPKRRFTPSKNIWSQVMPQKQFLKQKAAQLRLHPTESEVIFSRKLQELGLDFVFQYPFLYQKIGGISDFYLPKQRIVIEIDGGYHLEEDQKCTDAEKDFVCERKLHKKVLRLTNKQATYLSMEQIKLLIEEKDKQPFKETVKPRKHTMKKWSTLTPSERVMQKEYIRKQAAKK